MNFREALAWILVGVLLFAFLQECRKKMPPACPELKSEVITMEEITGGDISKSYTPEPKKTEYAPGIGPVSDRLFPTHPVSPCDSFVQVVPIYVPASPVTGPVDINYYEDTLKIDTLGWVRVRDTVAGRLLARAFDYSIRQKTVVHTVEEPKRAHWYLGIDAMGGRSNYLLYAGFDIGYQGKRNKNIYRIGAGLMQNEPVFKAGIQIPLNK